MPSDNTASNSTSSSVSPKVYVPSITIVALLVLITITGAVILFVRAYKQRKRRQSRVSKSDAEAGLSGADAPRRFWSTREGRNDNTRDPRLPKEPSNSRQVNTIRPPERAHINKGSRRFSRDAREIVEQGFGFGRSNSNAKAPRAVVVGRGYTVRHVDEIARKEPQMAEASINITPAPALVGKIERLTGNPLSNDLYAERASGATSSQSRRIRATASQDPRRHSHPPALSAQTNFPSLADPKPPLKVETQFSPVSAITESSRDFSPNYNEALGIAHALSPPPAPSVSADLRLKYPNVTALAQATSEEANKSSKRASKRLSYTYEGTSQTEHIATQYNPIKQHRLTFNRAPRTGSSSHSLITPFSTAFGGRSADSNNGNDNPRSAGLQGTFSKTEASPTSVKVPPHRRSWSGRSVLELDVPTSKPPPPPLPPPRRSVSPAIGSLSQSNLDPKTPKFATSPRARTSALGPRRSPQPPLPPIPSAGPPPARDSLGVDALLAGLSRSGSISKASVASMPSSISSFNTVTAGNPVMHGLTPTPAPRAPLLNLPLPPPPPPPNSLEGEDLSRKNSRRSAGDDASTVLTETSEGNLTERELEMEMSKIRERARRVSEERRRWRREEEERERMVGGDGTETKLGVGYRFI